MSWERVDTWGIWEKLEREEKGGPDIIIISKIK